MERLAETSSTDPEASGARATVATGLAAIGAAICTIVGSLGAWSVYRLTGSDGTVILETVATGTDGDGWITAGMAVAAAIFLIARLTRRLGWWASWVAFSLLSLVALVGVVDWLYLRQWANRNTFSSELISATRDIGWGMLFVTVGGLAGTALALAFALRQAPRHLPKPVNTGAREIVVTESGVPFEPVNASPEN